MPRRQEPSYAIKRPAKIIATLLVHASGVQRSPDLHLTYISGPLLFREGNLHVDSRFERCMRRGDSCTESIAHGLEDVTAILLYAAAQDLIVPREGSAHLLRVLLPALS